MTHDRNYYRVLITAELLRIARDEGLNPEMAITIADKLAGQIRATTHTVGAYHFNTNQTGDQ